MKWLHHNWVKYWAAPLLIAVLVFSLIQPGLAYALSPPPTLASFLAGGDNVTTGLVSVEGSGFEQVYYDFQGQQYVVTDDNYWKQNVVSDGEFIVWRAAIGAGWQIFLYNMITDTEFQLSSGENNLDPQINNGQVVWRGWMDEGSWQIFLYDGLSVRQVTSGDSSYNPVIKNGVIIFNRKNSNLNEWRAVSYNIANDITQVLLIGTNSKDPYFDISGDIAFKAEDERNAYLAFLASISTQEILGGEEDPEEPSFETLEEVIAAYGLRCPAIERTICGKDGVSYLNACVSTHAGTTPSSIGTCEGNPIQTLALWSENYEGDLTHLAEGGESTKAQGASDETEVVAPRQPETTEEMLAYYGLQWCFTTDAPVCGTDGVSYLNECVSIGVGAKKETEGLCEDKSIESHFLWSDNYRGDLFGQGSSEMLSAYLEAQDAEVAEEEITNEPEEPKTVTEEEIIEELSGESLAGEELIEGEELLLEGASIKAQGASDDDEEEEVIELPEEITPTLIEEDEIGAPIQDVGD